MDSTRLSDDEID
jgi:hypothetical protein